MPEEREVISVGVIYRAANGHSVEGRAHDDCETAIRAKGLDPADFAIELTEITDEINPWPGAKKTARPERCVWA